MPTCSSSARLRKKKNPENGPRLRVRGRSEVRIGRRIFDLCVLATPALAEAVFLEVDRSILVMIIGGFCKGQSR